MTGALFGGLTLCTVIVGAVLSRTAPRPEGLTFADNVAPLTMGMFAVVGTVLVTKRPSHPFGWLLIGFSFSQGAGGVGHTLARHGVSVPVAGVAAWVSSWTWTPAISLLAVGLLLFPDGKLPSRRWRPVLALPIAALLGSAVLAVALWPHRGPELLLVDDQWPGAAGAVGNVLLPLILVGFVAALVSLVVRFRSSGTIVRLQLKWLLFAVSMLAGALVLAALSDTFGLATRLVQDMLGVGGLLFLPVAVAFAVLRYRLFDIDRIISRSVSYALVTAVLAGVYASGVLGIGRLVPGGASDVLVAGSTLAVAALFQPLRRRVQSAVDRRFNRARYDAQAEAAAFGARLRDQLDLRHLSLELTGVTARTLGPRSVSLWLPPSQEQGV